MAKIIQNRRNVRSPSAKITYVEQLGAKLQQRKGASRYSTGGAAR
jgi:hypothetical protein